MKNIFDLTKWEQSNLEKEIIAGANEKTFNARWVAKELEKKNEIAELELKYKKELLEKEIFYNEQISQINRVNKELVSSLNNNHTEKLSELREEMKTELGIKAIELEKDLAVSKKSNAELLNNIIILTNDKSNLEKELKEMTATALKYAEKSAEVKVVDTKVISPQILESKINVIPTCGK